MLHAFMLSDPKTFQDCAAQAGMERYWICSNGYAIHVPNEVPLWTEHNSGRLSLQAQIDSSPYVGFFVSLFCFVFN